MDKSDLEACSELMLKVFSGEPWYDQWDSVQHVQQYLAEFMDNPVFLGFVIEQDGKILGASFGHTKSWYSGKEYHIQEYYIDTGWQGSGLGSALMNGMKAYLSSVHIHCMVLLTEKDLPAENFYRKHGFEVKKDIIFMANRF
ncbi:GNAT family N-acetyltransferase [Virgibacillus sp. LDC1]|uniref:GNAT family N-acetyltransferase n=1 Tax=Paenibacillus lautus TaxID=1401 RepID=UPI002DBD0635|nr:GNAT family N-acetyltransferase [Paenibacillus lautus]MCV4234383.1 GNAT family N-acetyltransferase [Virgibacillus sp. LDC1]MEC0260124.1 GNAT family N-acetyltransferase [Paenibacillus lautus]